MKFMTNLVLATSVALLSSNVYANTQNVERHDAMAVTSQTAMIQANHVKTMKCLRCKHSRWQRHSHTRRWHGMKRYHHYHRWHLNPYRHRHYHFGFGYYHHPYYHPHVVVRPFGYYGKPFYYHNRTWYWVTYGVVPASAMVVAYKHKRPVFSCLAKKSGVWYEGRARKGGACVYFRNGKRMISSKYFVRTRAGHRVIF